MVESLVELKADNWAVLKADRKECSSVAKWVVLMAAVWVCLLVAWKAA